MTSIARRIDAIIRNGLAQELKAAGYRKSGRTWRLAAPAYTLITSLQASRWNSDEAGEFTLNLGVHFPKAVELQGFPVADPPKDSDCMVRDRIGSLLPEHRDTWWKVDSTTNVELLGQQVARLWVTFAQPWLITHSDASVARSFLEHDDHYWWAAVMSTMIGDLDGARSSFAKAMSRVADRPDLQARLQEGRSGLGF